MLGMEEADYAEVAMFVVSMLVVNSLVFVWCGLLEIVERYGLFQQSKLHTKVLDST